MTTVPLDLRMSSASGVVGPLAASAMIFARMRGAFSRVITASRAAGTRMSTGSSSSSAFEIFWPLAAVTVPFLSLAALTSSVRRPFLS